MEYGYATHSTGWISEMYFDSMPLLLYMRGHMSMRPCSDGNCNNSRMSCSRYGPGTSQNLNMIVSGIALE